MRIFKWALFFVFSFAVSFILIMTFSQASFKQAVPGRIFTYITPAIPIYYYILGSFLIGLLLGLFVAFYNFITSIPGSFKKSKKIKKLEKDVDFLSDQQASISPPIEEPPPVEETVKEPQDISEPEKEESKKTSENLKDDDAIDSFIG